MVNIKQAANGYIVTLDEDDYYVCTTLVEVLNMVVYHYGKKGSKAQLITPEDENTKIS